MEVAISPPETPVALTEGYVQSKETTIVMQCHDRTFRDVEVFDESGQALFTVSSPPVFGSYSWRRIIKDATGTPVFHLRRNAKVSRIFECKWVVEDPDGREICYMHHPFLSDSRMVDVHIKNKEEQDKETIVGVRPKDQAGLTTFVNVEDALVAEIFMVEVNKQLGYDRSVWKARVASGVDLCLVSTQCQIRVF